MSDISLGRINRQTITKLRSFQIPGEPDMIVEIIGILTSSAPVKISKIKSAMGVGDFEAAGREAHALKSSALSLGAERLGAICQQIEALGSNDGAEMLLQQLEQEYAAVEVELTQIKTESAAGAK